MFFMARLKLRLAIFAIILVPACAIGFSLGGTAGAFVCALLSLSILLNTKTRIVRDPVTDESRVVSDW
jgi:hypothetical protein